jgi:hypothetical protein
MASSKRNFETIGRRIRQAVNAIGPKIVILALLAVRYDG